MKATRGASKLAGLVLLFCTTAFAGRSLVVMPDPPILNFLNFPDPNTRLITGLGVGNPILIVILNNPSTVTQTVTTKVNLTKGTGCALKSNSLVAGVGGVTGGYVNHACTPIGSAGAVTCNLPTVTIPPSSSVALNVVPQGSLCIADVVFLGTTVEISVAENSGFLMGSINLQCPALTIQTPFVTRINQGKAF